MHYDGTAVIQHTCGTYWVCVLKIRRTNKQTNKQECFEVKYLFPVSGLMKVNAHRIE